MNIPGVQNSGRDPNSGHGHVHERPDGVKARCGGPGICTECSREQAQLLASYRPQEPPADQQPWVACERCKQMFPPGQLYSCGPGGQWRYCGRCQSAAASKASVTSNDVAVRARKYREERGHWDTHAEALCAEVERLTRERDEYRRMWGEAKRALDALSAAPASTDDAVIALGLIKDRLRTFLAVGDAHLDQDSEEAEQANSDAWHALKDEIEAAPAQPEGAADSCGCTVDERTGAIIGDPCPACASQKTTEFRNELLDRAATPVETAERQSGWPVETAPEQGTPADYLRELVEFVEPYNDAQEKIVKGARAVLAALKTTQLPCDKCGRGVDEHIGVGMPCPPSCDPLLGPSPRPRVPNAERCLSESCPKCGNRMFNWPGLMTKCAKCLHEWYMDSSLKASEPRKTRYCDHDFCERLFDPAHSESDHKATERQPIVVVGPTCGKDTPDGPCLSDRDHDGACDGLPY